MRKAKNADFASEPIFAKRILLALSQAEIPRLAQRDADNTCHRLCFAGMFR